MTYREGLIESGLRVGRSFVMESKARKKGGPDGVGIKMAKTVFTYIHTYRDYLSWDKRGRKDSNGSYISHQHISLIRSASCIQQIDSFR
jgi:hypothetical protein